MHAVFYEDRNEVDTLECQYIIVMLLNSQKKIELLRLAFPYSTVMFY